jgi:small subunit ribosomal protein S17
MAEEEKDEQGNENEEPQAEAAEEGAAEAPAEEPAAEEPAAEEAPAPQADAEPQEVLSPKQQRKRDRSVHAGEAGPERDVPERQAERDAARQVKAQRRRAHRVKSREKAKARRAAEPHVEATPVERPHGRAKLRQGVVVSDKADKTITVRVDLARRHTRYEKIVRSSSTLHAHDETNEASVGDTVRVIESRPLSRTKRWRLVEVLERAK